MQLLQLMRKICEHRCHATRWSSSLERKDLGRALQPLGKSVQTDGREETEDESTENGEAEDEERLG